MSSVATFTVRDLSRRTAELLEVVRRYGAVEVCSRSGEVFTISPKRAPKGKNKQGQPDSVDAHFADLWERQRELGYTPPKVNDWDEERFNRIIAGEE
jgi:antitoxin (DNA-binding transcriptional repressor) of toxin-antitoxin stability system